MTSATTKTRLKANPICKLKAVLAKPMTHGPINEPTPANVNNVPRIVLIFSFTSSDTAAVRVGKMMEKKKPVNGKKNVKFVKMPIDKEIRLPTPANKTERT